jgi:hypothetical protein
MLDAILIQFSEVFLIYVGCVRILFVICEYQLAQ